MTRRKVKVRVTSVVDGSSNVHPSMRRAAEAAGVCIETVRRYAASGEEIYGIRFERIEPEGAHPEGVAEVARMRNEGLTNQEICEALPFTLGTVETYISIAISLGLTKRWLTLFPHPSKPTKAPPVIRAGEIAKMRNRGMTNRQIVAETGLSMSSVVRLARAAVELGLTKTWAQVGSVTPPPGMGAQP